MFLWVNVSGHISPQNQWKSLKLYKLNCISHKMFWWILFLCCDKHILLSHSCVTKCFTFASVYYFSVKILIIVKMIHKGCTVSVLKMFHEIHLMHNHQFHLNDCWPLGPCVQFCSSFFSCELEWPICDKNGLSMAAIFSQITDFPLWIAEEKQKGELRSAKCSFSANSQKI